MAASKAVYPNSYYAPETPDLSDKRNKKPYRSIRNVQINSGKSTPNQPTHEQFTESYASRGAQTTDQTSNSSPQVRNVAVEANSETKYSKLTVKQRVFRNQTKTSSKTKIKTSKKDHSKALAANTLIRTIGFTFYPLQFVFALFSNLFLASGDIFVLDVSGLFLLADLVVAALAFVTIISMYIIYKSANLNPLDGSGNATKNSVLLIMIIGYIAPITNILPWFLLWTIVVQRYPK